jgi:hypothetical protein
MTALHRLNRFAPLPPGYGCTDCPGNCPDPCPDPCQPPSTPCCDGTTPQYLLATIAGITSSPLNFQDCSYYNGSYPLTRVGNSCVWVGSLCTLRRLYGLAKGYASITITLTTRDGNWVLVGTLGLGAQYEANLGPVVVGELVSCASLIGITLSWVAGGSEGCDDCKLSGSSITLSSSDGSQTNPPCQEPPEACWELPAFPFYGVRPWYVRVTFSGTIKPSRDNSEVCSDAELTAMCQATFNNAWILEVETLHTCYWKYINPSPGGSCWLKSIEVGWGGWPGYFWLVMYWAMSASREIRMGFQNSETIQITCGYGHYPAGYATRTLTLTERSNSGLGLACPCDSATAQIEFLMR